MKTYMRLRVYDERNSLNTYQRQKYFGDNT
jgi:hypothetical protein